MAATITSWSIKNNNGTTADIELIGTGFGTTQYPIQHNGVAITVTSWTDTLIQGTVPSSALDPSIEGKLLASASDSLLGYLDAKVNKSITVSGDKLQLVGDAATPGNNKVYGTDGAGTKGFRDFPAQRNITISTSAPSGGANGDIWIKYTA